MITSAIIAGLIAVGAYLFGRPVEESIAYGGFFFLAFSFNMARTEVEELKLILDDEAPGWRERNAVWTSTWDWNRMFKRKLRKQRRLIP